MHIHREPPRKTGNNSKLTYDLYKSYVNLHGRSDDIYNEFVKGKSVCLVGPSPSLEGSSSGNIIDGYDLVVRLNRAFPVSDSLSSDIGSRTSIHYHCLNTANVCGGPIFFNEMKRDDVYVASPYPKFVNPFHLDVVNFEKQNNMGLRFHVIDTKFYLNIANALGTRPNSGIGAIIDLLAQDIDKLYVTGFTFFKDGWRKSYKDLVKLLGVSGESVQEKWLKTGFNGTHIQEPQMQIVKDLYLNDDRLELDVVMKDILNLA